MTEIHTKTFLKHDDYMTPKSAWKNIKQYIPKDKIIWEAFYGNGLSGYYLRELGFEVIHDPVDFFENNLGDVIVSHPPLYKTKDILDRLHELDKSFILLLPSDKINTQYFRKWKNKIQIIIPRRRIHFIKNGIQTKRSNFDCLYFCYKMNLPSDIVWLEE